jgi:hypothetical protein
MFPKVIEWYQTYSRSLKTPFHHLLPVLERHYYSSYSFLPYLSATWFNLSSVPQFPLLDISFLSFLKRMTTLISCRLSWIHLFLFHNHVNIKEKTYYFSLVPGTSFLHISSLRAFHTSNWSFFFIELSKSLDTTIPKEN